MPPVQSVKCLCYVRFTGKLALKTKRKLLNQMHYQLLIPYAFQNKKYPCKKIYYMYKQLLILSFTSYRIQFWGSSKNSNIKIIQSFQSIFHEEK